MTLHWFDGDKPKETKKERKAREKGEKRAKKIRQQLDDYERRLKNSEPESLHEAFKMQAEFNKKERKAMEAAKKAKAKAENAAEKAREEAERIKGRTEYSFDVPECNADQFWGVPMKEASKAMAEAGKAMAEAGIEMRNNFFKMKDDHPNIKCTKTCAECGETFIGEHKTCPKCGSNSFSTVIVTRK